MRGNQIVAVLFLTLLMTPTFARRKKNCGLTLGEEKVFLLYPKESDGRVIRGEFFMPSFPQDSKRNTPKENLNEDVIEKAEADISEEAHWEENNLSYDEMQEQHIVGGPDSLPPIELPMEDPEVFTENFEPEPEEQYNPEDYIEGGPGSLPPEPSFEPAQEMISEEFQEPDNEIVTDHVVGGPDSLPPVDFLIDEAANFHEEQMPDEHFVGGPGSLPPADVLFEGNNPMEEQMNVPETQEEHIVGGPESLPPAELQIPQQNQVDDTVYNGFHEEEKPEEHFVGGEGSLPPTDIIFNEEPQLEETIQTSFPQEFIVGGPGSLPPDAFDFPKLEENVDTTTQISTKSLESNTSPQQAEQTSVTETTPITNADDFLSEAKSIIVNEEETPAQSSITESATQNEAVKAETVLVYKPQIRSSIYPGQSLLEGEKLTSGNGLYQLVLQTDGNLVLYKVYQGYDPIVLWASGTVNKGTAPRRLVYQGNNNLVLYDARDKVVFTPNSCCSMPGVFILQDDGNAVVYNSEKKATWATGTVDQTTWVMRPADQAAYSLKEGQTITVDQSITSLNGKYRCVVQSDGNFVMYKNGNSAPWATGTSSNVRPFFLTLQGDGNLVLYDAKNKALWASGTNGKGISPRQLIMQDDGNLVLYDAKMNPIFATGQK